MSTSKDWYKNRVANDPHWFKMRDKASSKLKERKCSIINCYQRVSLEWHHVDYSRLGTEREWKDLRLLCHKHHMSAHRIFWVFKFPLKKRYLYARYLGMQTFQSGVAFIRWVKVSYSISKKSNRRSSYDSR